MAAYTTPAKVRAALTGVETPVTGTPGEMGDAALASEIEAAQVQVDAMLAGRYRVPFTDGHVPPLVARITLALACWHATLTYRREVDLTERDPVGLRKAEAMKLLDRIAAGTADLQLDADGNGVSDPSPGRAVRAINTVPALFGPSDFYLDDRR